MQYQDKGMFGFTSTAFYTTEASGTVTLTIQRNHGIKGVIDISYSTSDGSASGGDDYQLSAGTVRFYDGDTTKTIDVPLLDDDETEAHFESFTVSLSLPDPTPEGAALTTAATEATVFVYDYGDGVALANDVFSATNATVSSSAGTSNQASSAEGGLALGWTVTDNEGQGGWVDSNGFAAKDAVFGAEEYGGLLAVTAFNPTHVFLRKTSWNWCGTTFAKLRPKRSDTAPVLKNALGSSTRVCRRCIYS